MNARKGKIIEENPSSNNMAIGQEGRSQQHLCQSLPFFFITSQLQQCQIRPKDGWGWPWTMNINNVLALANPFYNLPIAIFSLNCLKLKFNSFWPDISTNSELAKMGHNQISMVDRKLLMGTFNFMIWTAAKS
jgi:hypothetical protein